MDSSMVWFHVTDRNFNPLDEGTPLQVKVFNKTLCSEFIDFARTQQPDLKDVFPQHIVVWKLVVPIPLSQKNDVEAVYDEMRLGGDTNGMDIDLPAKKLEHWDNMIPPDENEISSSDPWPEKHLHLLVQITREDKMEQSGDPDEKRAISGVSRVLRAHGLTLVDPSYLTVHVRTFGSWSEEDLHDSLNNIKLVDGLDDFRIAKKTLKDAEADLDRVRTLSDSDLIETAANKYLTKLLQQASQSPVFDTASKAINNVFEPEIAAFCQVNGTYLRWTESVKPKSSFLKDAWFTSALVAPPMLELVNASGLAARKFTYDAGVGCPLPLLVKDKKGATRKYRPSPDFFLFPHGATVDAKTTSFFPLLIGEVVSDEKMSDERRMLLQLAVSARMNAVSSEGTDPFIVQAIYVTRDLVVHRYLAYADITHMERGKLPTVYISRTKFNVSTYDGANRFLRSMYNFKGKVIDTGSRLKTGLEELCNKLSESLWMLPSLSSKKPSIKQSQAPNKGSNKGATGNLGSINEVIESLALHGYYHLRQSSEHDHIWYATSKSGEKVILKLVRQSQQSEIDILLTLQGAEHPHNHTIPVLEIISLSNASIIVMPALDSLVDCDNLSIDEALAFGVQLLEAVSFLHTQGIAHRDLKPHNVVVDRKKCKLFVIDYDLASWVKGRDDTAHGYVGSTGFTAPEVVEGDYEERYHSPVEADLWATGKLLSIMMILCGFPSRSDTGNLGPVMDRLMERDPEERPSAGQALQMLMFTGTTEATQLDDSAIMTTGTQPLESTHPVAVH